MKLCVWVSRAVLMLLHAQSISNSSLTMYTHVLYHHGVIIHSMCQTYSQNGWTPLMKASIEGRVDIVRLLIEAKAQINAQDEV